MKQIKKYTDYLNENSDNPSDKYKVKVNFIFEGEYLVNADSIKDASEIVAENAWAIIYEIGGDDNDDRIVNWDVDTHNSDIIIKDIKKINKK